MILSQSLSQINFATDDGRPVGTYVLDDDFKPYLHPLHTPAGRVISAAITHDHKHHKGLMYALRPRDVNFWEERATLPGEVVGRQVQTSLDFDASGNGFTQELHWAAEDGSLASFNEVRRISVSDMGDRYVWTWSTSLTPLRDMVLVQSQWSIPNAAGNPINYHGLGLRMVRSFGGMRTSAKLSIDGRDMEFQDGLGETPSSVTVIGAFDGTWPPPRAGVTIEQEQSYALFCLRDPFAYLAFGPSNAAELPLSKGQIINETYRIAIFDAPAATS